jgi:hypothetical protein
LMTRRFSRRSTLRCTASAMAKPCYAAVEQLRIGGSPAKQRPVQSFDFCPLLNENGSHVG